MLVIDLENISNANWDEGHSFVVTRDTHYIDYFWKIALGTLQFAGTLAFIMSIYKAFVAMKSRRIVTKYTKR